MAEPRRGLGFALLLLSMLLAAACWFDVGSAGALAWLAQVPAALGVALLRGTRGKARLGRDAAGAAAGADTGAGAGIEAATGAAGATLTARSGRFFFTKPTTLLSVG